MCIVLDDVSKVRPKDGTLAESPKNGVIGQNQNLIEQKPRNFE